MWLVTTLLDNAGLHFTSERISRRGEREEAIFEEIMAEKLKEDMNPKDSESTVSPHQNVNCNFMSLPSMEKPVVLAVHRVYP